jgi:hypothetical protein
MENVIQLEEPMLRGDTGRENRPKRRMLRIGSQNETHSVLKLLKGFKKLSPKNVSLSGS